MTISILIVDDHPVSSLWSTYVDWHRTGYAGSRATVPLALRRWQSPPGQTFDLVLMDINLPDLTGLEVTRRLRMLQPALRVLVISMLDDATVFNALKGRRMWVHPERCQRGRNRACPPRHGGGRSHC